MCVECLADAHCCPGAVCDGDNRCVPCIVIGDNGAEVDPGCFTAKPICDDTYAEIETCVECLDDQTGPTTPDTGCNEGLPACDRDCFDPDGAGPAGG